MTLTTRLLRTQNAAPQSLNSIGLRVSKVAAVFIFRIGSNADEVSETKLSSEVINEFWESLQET